MSDSPDGPTAATSPANPSTNISPNVGDLRSELPLRPETSSNAVGDTGDSGLATVDPANRRRGSRGGRKRRSGSGSPSSKDSNGSKGSHGSNDEDPQDLAEYERRPADLPDSPFEGVPSVEAAARAEVRPRIGDSRPAIGTQQQTEIANSSDPAETGRVSGPRKSRRGGRSKGNRSEEGGGRDGSDGSRQPRPSRSDRIAAALDDENPTAIEGGASSDINRTSRRNAQKNNASTGGMAVQPGSDRTNVRTVNDRTINEQTSNDVGDGDSPRKGRRGGNAAKTRGRSSVVIDPVERPRGRERNGRPVGRFLMCVHAHAKATQIAVLEGRSLIEHYVSRPTDNANQIHGNIYLGRVQNVLPGMEAAFVDIGTPKNAVVYRGDLQFDAGDIESSGKKKDDVRIEQVLKNRQLVLCQVTKNPIGSKGARLTQDVSIPGRFVVFVPNSDTYGISKRLGDEERKRLRRILDEIRPENHGLIVRTAAEGATPDELRRDVALLMRQWEVIEAKAKKANSPMLLHKEPDMAVRVIREEFNQNYRGIVIDDRELYEEVRSYVESISPELADRVEFHDSSVEPLPLFEKHHVHEQLHKAIDRKVWLPSGGSLIIERTEALTVIDVNTGKNVGSSSLEETVFRNNLEAADEIARQLRLRDIGGIVVIDFIDMEIRANREAVIGTFRDALSRDKTRTQVFDISELGLVEMTRKRISEGLVESLSEGCPMCAGRGFTFDSDLID